MEKKKSDMSVEELFQQHCASKSVATGAVRTLKKALGCEELTPEVLLRLSFCELCSAKGVGRKTVLLAAEVACDLAKMK